MLRQWTLAHCGVSMLSLWSMGAGTIFSCVGIILHYVFVQFVCRMIRFSTFLHGALPANYNHTS